MTQWHTLNSNAYTCVYYLHMQIRNNTRMHFHTCPMTWQMKYKSYTLLYRERSATYLHNVCESSTAGRERERERQREDGKDRKRERARERARGVTERKGEGWRRRALVLAEFIEVGVKKCYTYSKHTDDKPHTHAAWATYFITKFQKHKENN